MFGDRTSVIVRSVRIAFALYSSPKFEFISFTKLLLATKTCSAYLLSSLIPKYNIRRSFGCTNVNYVIVDRTSSDMNSFVKLKKISVASVALNTSPCPKQYNNFVIKKTHCLGLIGVSLKTRVSCKTWILSIFCKGNGSIRCVRYAIVQK